MFEEWEESEMESVYVDWEVGRVRLTWMPHKKITQDYGLGTCRRSHLGVRNINS